MSFISAMPRYLSDQPRWVRLRNVRGFADLTLDMPTAAEGPLLIIGRNGTCKSTLLRCIAIAAGTEKDVTSLLDSPVGSLVGLFGQRGQLEMGFDSISDRKAKSHIEFSDSIERGTQLDWHVSRTLNEDSPFVAAYGASRFFTGPESSSNSSYGLSDACATLFNRPTPLGDPELTLRRLKDWFANIPEAFSRVWHGIREVVGLTTEDDIEIGRGGGLRAQGPTIGAGVDFRALADGYRVTFNWVIDFYAQALRANAIDENGHVHGMLLVDEIEQHLHPAMQLEILPRLAALFPHVQIIATTHSPQVALSVLPEHLVSLKRHPNSGTVSRVPVVDFARFTAEDVLTDPSLFESPSESPALQKSRDQYRLLRRKASHSRTPREETELSELARTINPVSAEPLAMADPQLAELLRDMGR